MFQKAPGRFASPPGELSFLPRGMGVPPMFPSQSLILSRVPIRVALFTDTLGDVNGVSRFLRTIAAHATPERGLHSLTSTRFDCPARPNIHNIPPLASIPMPGYAPLDLALPNARALIARAAALAPHAVHISTPGPVGLLGRRFALAHNLPLIGTYHTDFPAYITHLFNDPALTWLSERATRRFYAPFDHILARSTSCAAPLASVGIHPDRSTAFPPGIDTDLFHSRHRNPAIWRTIPNARPHSIKLLYVGRVSIEKNLPMLARLWPRFRAAAIAHAIDTQLILIGDGPYRPTMERELAAHDALFLGFRRGQDLSALYASSDLFLFPSTTDTLGQAVLEAQSSGLPALVSNRGGPSSIVHHDHTGFILPVPPAPSAEHLWITAALSLLTNPARRHAMSAAAHEKIQPLTIARSFNAFWNAHEQAIESRRAGQAKN